MKSSDTTGSYQRPVHHNMSPTADVLPDYRRVRQEDSLCGLNNGGVPLTTNEMTERILADLRPFVDDSLSPSRTAREGRQHKYQHKSVHMGQRKKSASPTSVVKRKSSPIPPSTPRTLESTYLQDSPASSMDATTDMSEHDEDEQDDWMNQKPPAARNLRKSPPSTASTAVEQSRKPPPVQHSTPNNEQQQQQQQHWDCPRCTLHNDVSDTSCQACNFKLVEHSVPEPLEPRQQRRRRRRALWTVPSTTTSIDTSTSTDLSSFVSNTTTTRNEHEDNGNQAFRFVITGAMTGAVLLGLLVGAVSLYQTGVGGDWWTGAVEGFWTGAIGGALWYDLFLEQQQQQHREGLVVDENLFRSQQERTSVRNGPTTASAAASTTTQIPSQPAAAAAFNHEEDPMVAFILRSMQETTATSSANTDSSYHHQVWNQRYGNSSTRVNRGAKQDVIAALPCMTVHDPSLLPEGRRHCPICLDSFVTGDKRKALPCLHGFHDACADQWLRTNGACPMCMHRIDQ